MSNRLHVGRTDDPLYDCVIDGIDDAREKLVCDFLYASPYKIRIGDMRLFEEVQPIIAAVFAECGRQYPDDVWAFYAGERSIQHPTQAELDEWLY